MDRSDGTVTVRGGTTIRRLNLELAAMGRALSSIGTLSEQTIAGALATGNDGTGIAFGPLSSLVTNLRLVTPDGEIRTVDRIRDPDVFRAAVTGLGALGVVSSVTLSTTAAFRLRVMRRQLPLTEFPAVLDVPAGWRRAGFDGTQEDCVRYVDEHWTDMRPA